MMDTETCTTPATDPLATCTFSIEAADATVTEIVKEAAAKIAAERAARNAAFAKLSRPRQRVQIAHDVLEQIRLHRITPRNGYWMNALDSARAKEPVKRDPKTPLDEVLEKVPVCQACALGSMFAVAVKRRNAFTVEQLGHYECGDHEVSVRGDWTIRNYLDDIFDADQLVLIELAFERGKGGYRANDDDVRALRKKEAAIGFAPRTRGAVKRMSHIMRNIIRNRGTFRPEQAPTPADRRAAAELLAASRRRAR